MTTITYGSSVKETAKSRRHARRRAVAIERDNLESVIDAAFGVKPLSLADKRMKAQQRVKSARKVAVIASGCSNRVLKAVASPSVREVKEGSGAMCLPQVAIYSAGHRKPTKSIYKAR